MVVLHPARAAAKPIGGCESRERPKVADQMRLVEIAAIDGQAGPIERGHALDSGLRLLEPSDASQELGLEPDLCGEEADEAPLAQPDSPYDLAHAGMRL